MYTCFMITMSAKLAKRTNCHFINRNGNRNYFNHWFHHNLALKWPSEKITVSLSKMAGYAGKQKRTKTVRLNVTLLNSSADGHVPHIMHLWFLSNWNVVSAWIAVRYCTIHLAFNWWCLFDCAMQIYTRVYRLSLAGKRWWYVSKLLLILLFSS